MTTTLITTQGAIMNLSALAYKTENFTYAGEETAHVAATALSDTLIGKIPGGVTNPGAASCNFYWDGAAIPALSSVADTLNLKLSNAKVMQASALLTGWGFELKEKAPLIASADIELVSKLTIPVAAPTVTASSVTPVTAQGTTITVAGFTFSLTGASYSGCKKEPVIVDILSEALTQKIPGGQTEPGTLSLNFLYDASSVPAAFTSDAEMTITFSNANAIKADVLLTTWDFDDSAGANGLGGTAKFELVSLWSAVA